MKDGFRFTGANAEASAGSFGRKSVSADAGGNNGTVAAFAAVEGIDDNGWRDHSSSRIRRMYARADTHTEHDDFNVAITLADNYLEGTQALPVSMLGNPKQAYTWPDTVDNKLGFVNANWRHAFAPDTVVAVNGYYRRLRTTGYNSNVNGDYAPPDQPYEAFNIYSDADTRAWGTSVQATFERSWLGMGHQIVIGAALDIGDTGFVQSAQPATFAVDRDTIGIGDYESETNVSTTNRYTGVYVADIISVAPQWSVSLSWRYNIARITTQDLSGETPDVNGVSTFRRFNPAAGFTWTPNPRINVFGGVSQGMRVPTPVELTCADPAAPCTLPNIFVADPPLQAVRATTYEAGVRGRVGASGFYSAALYRTDLVNDIQFIGVGSGAVNAGYFQNNGKTRRQGIELSGGATVGEVSLVARYSFLDATFQTAFLESSPNNSSADAAGLIEVQPGNRLPALPRNALRLRADWTHGPFALGATLVAFDGQYSRGDENNADAGGKVPGYVVVALDASCRWRGSGNFSAHRQSVQSDVPEFWHPGCQLFPRTGQHVRCESGGTGSIPLSRRALRYLGRDSIRARPRRRKPLSSRVSPSPRSIALPVQFSRRRFLENLAALGLAVVARPVWPDRTALDRPALDFCTTGDRRLQRLWVPGDSGYLGRLTPLGEPLTLTASASGGAHLAITERPLAFVARRRGRRYTNPTLVVQRGERMRINLVNALSEPTITHWHGLAVNTNNDGNGSFLVSPGGRYAYDFEVRDRGGMYWYHPHPHGRTAAQTYRGLYGVILVEDDDERVLRAALDLTPGRTDIPLVVQDRRAGGATLPRPQTLPTASSATTSLSTVRSVRISMSPRACTDFGCSTQRTRGRSRSPFARRRAPSSRSR